MQRKIIICFLIVTVLGTMWYGLNASPKQLTDQDLYEIEMEIVTLVKGKIFPENLCVFEMGRDSLKPTYRCFVNLPSKLNINGSMIDIEAIAIIFLRPNYCGIHYTHSMYPLPMTECKDLLKQLKGLK